MEPNLDWVHNLFKFNNFYDQIDLDPDQNLAVIKAIIKLTNMLKGPNSELIKKSLHMKMRYKDDAIIL